MLDLAWNTIILLLGIFSSVVSQACISPTSLCDCFQEKGRKVINCRYKNLTAIPTFIDTRQTYDEIRFTSSENTGTCQLSWGCNRITRIDANSFANLKVKLIDLRNNPVTYVDVTAFLSLVPTLESLLLEGDGGSVLPYQALASLDIHLKTLHLENYGSAVLQSPIVLPFPNLESLTLKNWTNLHSITANVVRIMQNLKTFRLLNMPSLVTLPVPAIHKFLKLTKIEIMETGVRSIFMDTFFLLSMLDQINIRNNIHLTSIDRDAFNGVTDTAVYLDTSSNNLNDIGFLQNGLWTVLSQLNIGYNFNLRTFPTGIFTATPALRYLSCHGIGLSKIDETMFIGLSNLHTLDIAYNQITDISTGTFQNSPSLIELRLHDQQAQNKLMNFKNKSFLGVESSLEVLNLMNNRFDMSRFWGDLTTLTNLKQLDLTNTGIGDIPNNAFRGNAALNTLLLSDNNISSIKQETFYGPRFYLQTVDLRRNAIQTIDQCVLNDFPRKPTIIIFGNPLVCDCELVWLYDWFKTQRNQAHLSTDIGTCATPTSLSNKFFNEFSRNDLCPGNQPVKTCPVLYVTDTISSSTSRTSSTITTTTTTKSPLPLFQLIIVNVDQSRVEVTWKIADNTVLTEIKLEMKSNVDSTRVIYLGPEQSSFIFYQLTSDTYYTVCLVLKINDEFRDAYAKCKHVKTLQSNEVKHSKSTTDLTLPDSVLG